jgi:CubicO group peptidase (beta-lactamase class C family)
MNVNPPELTACIERQRDPEPFSGVVRVTHGEAVLFEGAYGLAIRSECIHNRIDTRFQTASGGKIFTAVAICRLIERGELSLDTRLTECVDEVFPDFSPEITIRHLLTHTSGITSYFEEDVAPDYEALWRDLPVYRVRGPRDFLPLFRDKPMKFAPGERFEYNDGGFILLGLVVERATGKPFPDVVEEAVFERAGMRDSGHFPADRLPDRTACAYIPDEDGSWRTNVFAVPAVGGPDGGAYATAPDLARFWSAFTGGRLLEAGTVRSLLEPQIATGLKPPHTHYGYGVWIDRPDERVRKWFVEGSDPGVAMRSALYPGPGVVLTMLGNTGGALWPLYREIEELLGL